MNKPCPIELAQRKERLAGFIYEYESTVIDALKYCRDDMPNSFISKYERALDALSAIQAEFLIRATVKRKQ